MGAAMSYLHRIDTLGRGVMGRGPRRQGLVATILVYKVEHQQEEGIEQNMSELKLLLSVVFFLRSRSPSPSGPVL
jgi:hypothetical protein